MLLTELVTNAVEGGQEVCAHLLCVRSLSVSVV